MARTLSVTVMGYVVSIDLYSAALNSYSTCRPREEP